MTMMMMPTLFEILLYNIFLSISLHPSARRRLAGGGRRLLPRIAPARRRRQGWFWSSAPMELCCREGPDGGTVPRGKNPRKWLALPGCSGLPLNGCMPRVAWQELGITSSRTTRNTSTSLHGGGCGANNGRRRRVVVVRLLLLLLLLQPTPPAWKKQPAPAAMDR